MALKIVVNNPYGETSPNGYINIKGYYFDRISKTGHIVLNVWHDENTRRSAGKSPIGTLQLAFGDTLKYDNFYMKDDISLYTELKKHVIKFNGEVVDLSSASDV